MATTAQVASLRLMVDEPGSSLLSDEQLSSMIDQADGNLDATASEIWQLKAARFATMVDVSESGSSRKMSDLYKNALQMASHFSSKTTEATTSSDDRPRTRTAVRR